LATRHEARATNALCIVGWNCLPLAKALSIEVAATSVIGRFVTTRERVMVSRPFTHHEQLYVQPQGQVASVRLHFHNWLYTGGYGPEKAILDKGY
jgi:hypothetical protein